MPKIPALKVARGLEKAFRPHDLCSIDQDYHVFVVAYSGSYVEHNHPADEFLFILEGELILEVAGQEHVLRQGDGFLVPAGTLHRPRSARRTLGLVMERRGLQTSSQSPLPV